MTLRKPLFMQEEGYAEEMASGDSVDLGALNMGGAISMNNHKVQGLARGTTAGDALVYGQTGGQLTGLDANSAKVTNVARATTNGDALVFGQTGAVFAAGTSSGEPLVYGQTGAQLTGLDANSAKVTNVARATTGGDALAYGQTGGQLTGLDLNNSQVTSAARATTSGNFLVYGQTGAHLSGLDADSAKVTNVAPATTNGDALVFGQTGAVFAAGTSSGEPLVYGQTGAHLTGLDVNSTKIINVAAGTNAFDVLVYGQTGGQLTGLDLNNSQVTNAARATTSGNFLVYGQTGAHLSGLDANSANVTNVARATTGGDALAYGQTGAQLTGLDANSAKVTNVARATTSGDALAYGQTGAQLTGLDLNNSQVTGAAAGTTSGNFLVYNQNGAVLNGLGVDNAKITNVARATTNGDALAYGQTGAQLTGLDLNGTKITNGARATTSGDFLIYGQTGGVLTGLSLSGNKLTYVANPDDPTDGANKGYVDSVAQGLKPKTPVEFLSDADLALTGLPVTIDGVTAEDGYRILLVNQNNAVQNGIWLVHSGAWTRPLDYAVGGIADGTYTLVQHGTKYGISGWTCNTHGSSIIDTDATYWVQFNGAGQVLAGDGLWKSGNTLRLRLQTDADAQGSSVGNNGGSSGLEFDSHSPAEVRVAVGATGGIQRVSGGISLLLDGSTLSKSSIGVKVESSPKVLMTGTTNDNAVVIGDPLYVTSTGTVDKALSTITSDVTSRVVGLVVAAADADSPVNFLSTGVITNLSGLVVGSPYYLNTTGGIVTPAPTAPCRVVQVGIALTNSTLLVRILDYGKKIS